MAGAWESGYAAAFKFKGFVSYLITEFLGALNDNLYRFVVAMLLIDLAVDPAAKANSQAMVSACFVLPYVLFSGYAGYLADVFSKQRVLVVTKAFEVVIMLAGLFAVLSGNSVFMLVILVMMAMQSVFFSPAKYGIIPEIIPDRHITRANGLVGLTTIMAIILGMIVGGSVLEKFRGELAIVGLFPIAVAVVGFAASLGIARVPPSGAARKFSLNPWKEAWAGIVGLYRRKDLFLTVMGISYFWYMGAMFQMLENLLGRDVMGLSYSQTSWLWGFMAAGTGLGSLAVGRLSGDKVEQGLVPLGSLGIGIFTIALSKATGSFGQASTVMFLIGFSSGIFHVPLQALLQQKTGAMEKGQFIAANNILNGVAMLLAAGTLSLLGTHLEIRADGILLILGLATFGVTAYILFRIPDFLIRFVLWLLTHTVYKIRIVGAENVPFRGPALLVCNHISHVDSLIVGACIQRFVRFLMYRPYAEIRILRHFLRLMNVIPISRGDGRRVLDALERARQELRDGHVVCIFAEGSVSRTGNMLPFRRGLERIMADLDVPIIPVHLDRLWGSIFSFREGKFLWKWPRQLPYPVTVSFGKPMPASSKAYEVRNAVMELGADAIFYRREKDDFLQIAFIAQAKKSRFALCLADSTGKELTYWRTLAGAIALNRWMNRSCAGQEMVGIMLPASVGGALANIAVTLGGRIPVNLNFTSGRDSIEYAVRQCGIRTILTSRVFLAKGRVDQMPGMVFLEDVLKEITPLDRSIGLVRALFVPSLLLKWAYRPKRTSPHDLATVIFTSGSTGMPKGVMLSHHNVLSNIESISQVFWVTKDDRMMGVLPFFHSFGFTGSMWFPAVTGFAAIYHPSPMDAEAIGRLIQKYRATIFISTPTFCIKYTAKCASEQFSSLRLMVVGAERLRPSIDAAFREKFGFGLLEGYGCTEMSPVVTANFPDVRYGTLHHFGTKPGTVGHPVPGVAVKVIDRETGEDLPPEREGLLLVRGPNRMMGYFKEPEKTEEALRGAWYVTGDIARIDSEGFISILDRVSRFTKIAGEMVPHERIEEEARRILGEIPVAVVGIPDEQRGEKIVLLYSGSAMGTVELHQKLAESGLARIWIPKVENIHRVEEIPILGTGKADLKAIKAKARELTEGPDAAG